MFARTSTWSFTFVSKLELELVPSYILPPSHFFCHVWNISSSQISFPLEYQESIIIFPTIPIFGIQTYPILYSLLYLTPIIKIPLIIFLRCVR